MSWAQVDGATKDETLRKRTNDGSTAFLSGASKVQHAMTALDVGNSREAGLVGSEAAKDFDEARLKFESARDRMKEHRNIANELNTHLRGVKYEDTAKTLGLFNLEVEVRGEQAGNVFRLLEIQRVAA